MKLCYCNGNTSVFNTSAGDTSGTCGAKGGISYTTNENVTLPWDSAITDLTSPAGQYSSPTNALLWSNALANACADHMRDIGPCGLTGHTGTDSSNPGI